MIEKMQIFKCSKCGESIDEATQKIQWAGANPFCEYCEPKLTDLEILEALQDATKKLGEIEGKIASGSLAVYRVIYNAKKHLNKQVEELLAPPAEIPEQYDGRCIERLEAAVSNVGVN